MEFKTTKLEGVIEMYPRIFNDERGYFFESFNSPLFRENGILEDFIQDNQSFSKKGVVRGLHFQNEPFAQGKLVRALKGAVLDVVVDIRPNSPTFGQWESFLLTEENRKMVYLPPGFAHGFSTLEDAIFSYKCTNVYHKESEGGIIYNDSDLAIDWKVDNPIVSEKDTELPTFANFASLV